ncbi:MAG: AAA family ATPase [Pseudomonadota bacterium]
MLTRQTANAVKGDGQGFSQGLGQSASPAAGTGASQAAGLGAAGDRPLAPGRALERRQLSVLNIDLAGSTEMSTRLDPEEYRDAMNAYILSVSRLVESEGGVVSDISGDSMQAFFGFPRASEDDAERAVRTGFAVGAEIEALQRRHGLSMKVRVGAATGLVVIGKDLMVNGRSHEIYGETPNLAARLQAVAEPGTVALCETTRRLCGGRFTYREVLPMTLKGFQAPVNVTLALSPIDLEASFAQGVDASSGPLVGREEEIEIIARRWDDTTRGRGRAVVLTGEAGIGKSRIIAAVSEMAGRDQPLFLRYFCAPHRQNSALHPFLDQIERAAGIARTDSAAERAAKLEAQFEAAADPLAGALVADALSMPHPRAEEVAALTPQARKRRTFDVLLAEFERLAHTRRILMIFEDLHWIDPSSLEMLVSLIERLARLPVLMIVSARPEFQAPWPDHAHVTTMSLSRLDSELGERLMANVTGTHALPRAVVMKILERADGVPLFIEELTKTVVESGSIEEMTSGHGTGGTRSDVSIPTTLHASLLARLDRLEPVRDVAQIGAALGREFSFDILQKVARLDAARLETALGQLVGSGLVLGRGTPPDAVYHFKHVLLRDAAYSSMLRPRRAELHARIAAALVDTVPHIAETEPETLAAHLGLAGEAEAAARHWLKAGNAAARRSANLEAIAHLTEGLDALSAMTAREGDEALERDRLELALRYALGPCLIATRGPAAGECLENFQRARVLCDALGDPPEALQVMFWFATAAVIRGELEEAAVGIQRLIEIARHREDRAATINALRGASMITLFMGRLVDSARYASEALEVFEAANEAERAGAAAAGQDPKMAALALESWVLWSSGRPEAGIARVEEAVVRAATVDHPHSLAYAGYYHAVLKALNGDHAAARAAADAVCRISEEHGFGHWSGLAAAVRSIAEAHLSSRVRAEELDATVRALNSYREAGYQLGVTALYVLVARAQLEHGSADIALEFAEIGIDFTDKQSERLFRAELMRLKAEAVLALDARRREEAAVLLVDAIRTAEAQGATMLELAAATTLAGLAAEAEIAGGSSAHALGAALGAGIDPAAALGAALSRMGDGHALPAVAEAHALHSRMTGDDGLARIAG